MAHALQSQLENPNFTHLAFEEQFGLLIDAEVCDREARRIGRLLKSARLRPSSATLEDVDYRPQRALDRSQLSARPLADEFARVYRDRLAATAMEGEQATLQVPCTSPFSLETGEVLSWEGVSFTVALVTTMQVTLVSENGRPVCIDVESIEQLAHDGKLAGPALADNAAARMREQIVRGACTRATAEWHARTQRLSAFRGGAAVSRSARTMRTYMARFRQAEVSVGDGSLGLIPDFKSRGNRTPRYPEAVFEIIADVEREARERKVRRTKVDLFGEIRDRCAQQGLQAPSAKTIAKWRRCHIGIHEDTLQFDGHRMAYDSKPWVSSSAVQWRAVPEKLRRPIENRWT